MWISLIGFMGSGKSTVAEVLATRSVVPVIDLDELIVERAGTTIADIFRNDGEARFRDLESEALAVVPFDDRDDGVLACGGGVVGRAVNRTLLREKTTVVWLDQPWENLRARLDGGVRGDRPLVDSLGLEGLEDLFLARRRLYAETAHFRIRSDRDDIETVARRVAACRRGGEGVTS